MGSCLLLPFQEIKVEEAEDAAGWELLSDGDDDMEGVIKRKGPQIAHKVAVSEAAEIAQPKAPKAKTRV